MNRAEKGEEALLSDKMEGLCATCLHLETCEYLKSFGSPRFECDEFEGIHPSALAGIIDKFGSSHGGIISILEAVQAKYGYLPRHALNLTAERTGRPLVDIYGVATFYKSFSLKPRGKHLLSVCLGTACHVRGAQAVAREFEEHLNVKAGDTTADKEFTLHTVNCLGACALGPVAVVDGHYFSKVNASKVRSIIDKTKTGLDAVDAQTDIRVFPLETSCPRCNHSFMDPERLLDGHPSIRVTVAFADKHGWLRLSSLYGSYSVESEDPIPKDTIVNFFCPHCHAEIAGATLCTDCGAPMVAMIVRGGGMLQICSRRGCKNHMFDLI
ncbi:MAG: NAD(P)H-dependent oxidoreductase subunit E [Candidatus Eisenbacteria bacterium]|nr:NAD(P)H-dependent oxidoreductase subunit E [Candidatus Eisenbacteria bacterium]